MSIPSQNSHRKKIDWKSLKKPDSVPFSVFEGVVSDPKPPVNWEALSIPYEENEVIDRAKSSSGRQISWTKLTENRDTK